MAEFECKVYELTIEPHPNADDIELAKVGDYYSIVKKGEFKTGSLGVYIPEAAVCPEWVITRLGLEGRLAGKKKNRVKAVRLRGILSQGLIYPLDYRENVIDSDTHEAKNVWVLSSTANGPGRSVEEGEDVTELLAITKYEPPIPVHMAGEVENHHGKTLSYDIENIKKYPDVFEEGEAVVITEKLHGTWVCFCHHPNVDHTIVTSKGLSAKGLVFKMNERNKDNLYIRALDKTGEDHLGATVIDRLRDKILKGTSLFSNEISWSTPIYLLGEIFGQGVQDLTYGFSEPQFRIFDIYVGVPGTGHFLTPLQVSMLASELDIEMVPIIYTGPFSKEIVAHHTKGLEVVSNKPDSHIREGIVITPTMERRDAELGRVKLKSISEDYLFRKGKTTEYV